jgi:integrase/recombinase XerC
MRLRGLSPASIYQRRRALARLEAFVGKPLLEATEDDLHRWQEQLRGSVAYIANRLANCSQLYAWAHGTADLLAENPARRMVRPKVGRGLPRPIGDAALDIAISTAAPDVRLCLVLGAYAGLRAGEMSRLERRDILDTVEAPVMLLQGKGGKERIVPASPRVLFELRAYGMPTRGPILRRRDGRPGAPTPARVSQLVNEHLHDLGIGDTLHAGRHRFATATYQISRDIRLVQELLGHSDPATTAVYAAYAASEAAAVVGALT